MGFFDVKQLTEEEYQNLPPLVPKGADRDAILNKIVDSWCTSHRETYDVDRHIELGGYVLENFALWDENSVGESFGRLGSPIDFGDVLRMVERRLCNEDALKDSEQYPSLFVLVRNCLIGLCNATKVSLHLRFKSQGLCFRSEAIFEEAHFGDWTSFESAVFCQNASFEYAQFGKRADFSKSQFCNRSVFDQSAFDDGARFEETNFYDHVGFFSAKFGLQASFKFAKFNDSAKFPSAQFADSADFESAIFANGAYFDLAAFGNCANFANTECHGNPSFHSTQFGDSANFKGAIFGDNTRFKGATFDALAKFESAKFGDLACFESATFGQHASFEEAAFGAWSQFDSARFGDPVSFPNTIFGPGGEFHTASVGRKDPEPSSRLMRTLAHPRRWLRDRFSWEHVRSGGQLEILTKVSYMSLVLVPILAGTWPAVRRAIHWSNDAVNALSDKGSRIEAAEPNLPWAWVLAFFAALCIAAGHLVYQLACDELVRVQSADGFIARRGKEFRDSVRQQQTDLLLRAFQHIERIAEMLPFARQRTLVRRHGRTIWIPKDFEELDRVRSLGNQMLGQAFGQTDTLADQPDTTEHVSEPGEVAAPKENVDQNFVRLDSGLPPFPKEDLQIIVIEEGARAEYDAAARENKVYAGVSATLYAAGGGLILWLVGDQTYAVLDAADRPSIFWWLTGAIFVATTCAFVTWRRKHFSGSSAPTTD